LISFKISSLHTSPRLHREEATRFQETRHVNSLRSWRRMSFLLLDMMVAVLTLWRLGGN
jgi:hypothetical protein